MTATRILLAGLGGASLLLAGCATTSGGTTAAAALQVSYPGDADMSCEALSAEIARMDMLMGANIQAAADAESRGNATAVGAGLATNAAVYSGAAGRVPGLGLAANAFGAHARNQAEAEAARREQDARTAELRRTGLMGIYQGRSC